MPKPSLPLAACALLAVTFTGCVNLKRVADPAHFYVLSAELTRTPPVETSRDDWAVGLGVVEVPAYLLDRRIAVSRGAHELSYLECDRWAERLDRGIQRVVAANVASLLPSDRVFLSAWRRDEVGAEVYISIQRFESDEDGGVILEGHWRITSPGGERTWRADHLHVARKGPAFRSDPGGAVDALSQALADLSQQIAAELRGVSTRAAVSKPGVTESKHEM